VSEEEPRKECPMCAGSGKVRDFTPSGGTVPTFFVIDTEKFDTSGLTVGIGT
jgi:hypothetical protein